MQKKSETFRVSSEKLLDKIIFPLNIGDIIFFYGDLGAGKTTFIRALLRQYSEKNDLVVRSPTYTYYQKYFLDTKNIYHFDLYRLENTENLALIGAEEILQNPQSISLIEWPEILGDTVSPTKIVKITQNPENSERIIEIIKP